MSLSKKTSDIAEEIGKVEVENERLRRENERLNRRPFQMLLINRDGSTQIRPAIYHMGIRLNLASLMQAHGIYAPADFDASAVATVQHREYTLVYAGPEPYRVYVER